MIDQTAHLKPKKLDIDKQSNNIFIVQCVDIDILVATKRDREGIR